MDGSGRATKSITANTPQISDGTLDEREAADVEVPNDRLSPVALGSQLLTVLGLFRRFGDQRAPEQPGLGRPHPLRRPRRLESHVL